MDNNTILVIAGAIGLIVGVWWFFTPSTNSAVIPKSRDEIRQLLESQGYQIKDIDSEDNTYEVEAYQNGKKFEIILDQSGNILKIKEDD